MRTTALMASTALAAGLLGPVVPAAIGASSAAADPVLPGIETAGPIPTVEAAAGPLWPELPVSLAQMPRGTVANPDSPYLSVPALRGTVELPVRVVDLSTGTGTQVWQGTLSRGWTRIGARLTRDAKNCS